MKRILLIGSGRLAKHLEFFFSKYAHIQTWNRRSGISLIDALKGMDQAWVLISDREIENFVKTHMSDFSGTWVHCSGALYIEGAIGAHPLMTFGPTLYPASNYPAIPFGIDKAGMTIQDLIPGIPNPSFYVPRDKKTLYHALCSFAGNSTTQLWQNAINVFRDELGVPAQTLNPFMQQIIDNVKADPENALSGPLARGDWAVVDKHLNALSQRPAMKAVYQSFVELFQTKDKGVTP